MKGTHSNNDHLCISKLLKAFTKLVFVFYTIQGWQNVQKIK